MEIVRSLPFILVSFILQPVGFIKGIQASRTNFDAEGRCVDPNSWAPGLNEDGTRKDGKPIGTKLPIWAFFFARTNCYRPAGKPAGLYCLTRHRTG